MYLSMITGFLFADMVFATELQKMHVSYNINYGGQMMRQRVVLNYRDNLIMIDASAIEGKTPARLIHHTEGMTQYRQAGFCFMLTGGFDVFSSDMDDWYEDGNEDVVLQSGDTVFYNYTISPFDINRESIPLAMQDECDEIYSAVLINIIRGNAARRQLNKADTPFVTVIHGPQRQVEKRNSDRYQRLANRNMVSAGIIGMYRATCPAAQRFRSMGVSDCGIAGCASVCQQAGPFANF